MKLSTKIDRMDLKVKILEAIGPVTYQVSLPYDGEQLRKAYETLSKKLDELLNIKWED